MSKLTRGMLNFGLSMVACGCAFVAGHATCMHRHGSDEDIHNAICNKNGDIDYWHYIKYAFKDHIDMGRDPYRFNRTQ